MREFILTGAEARRDSVEVAVEGVLVQRVSGDRVDVELGGTGPTISEARVFARWPYETAREVWLAVNAADAITRVTGWRAYDPLRKLYLDDFLHPWRAYLFIAAHRVSSLDVRERELLVTTSPYAGKPALWRWQLGSAAPSFARLPGMAASARFTDDGALVVAISEGVNYPQLDRVAREQGVWGPWLAIEPCYAVMPLGARRAITSNGEIVDLESGQRSKSVRSGTFRMSPVRGGVVLGTEIFDENKLRCALQANDHHPSAIAMSRAGDLVASGGWDKRIVVADAATGQTRVTISKCGEVSAIDISPDGKRIASGAAAPRIKVWTIEGAAVASLNATGTPQAWDGIRGPHVKDAKESGRKVEQLQFLDDQRVIAAFNDARIVIYDVARKQPIATLGLFDDGQWVALAPDGTWDGSATLRTVQFAWDTDMRSYRDIVVLDPSARRAGWLARALG